MWRENLTNFFKMLYISFLYEFIILKSDDLLRKIALVYLLINFTVMYKQIITFSFIECIIYVITVISVFSIIVFMLVLPYIIYIPGDGSLIEKILINSKTMYAHLLIEHKKKTLDKK